MKVHRCIRCMSRPQMATMLQAAALLGGLASMAAAAAAVKPHIVFFMADDTGWYNVCG
jgi:ABC-type sugar transport system substrate-binding protein